MLLQRLQDAEKVLTPYNVMNKQTQTFYHYDYVSIQFDFVCDTTQLFNIKNLATLGPCLRMRSFAPRVDENPDTFFADLKSSFLNFEHYFPILFCFKFFLSLVSNIVSIQFTFFFFVLSLDDLLVVYDTLHLISTLFAWISHRIF